MKTIVQGLLLALLTLVIGITFVIQISRPYVVRELREMILKQDLHELRKTLDQYALDQGMPAQSLHDLTRQGYIRDIPFDPMTNKQDWDVEFGEVPGLPIGKYGIIDVYSSSIEISAAGIPYNEY